MAMLTVVAASAPDLRALEADVGDAVDVLDRLRDRHALQVYVKRAIEVALLL